MLLDDALRRRIVTWEDLCGCYLNHDVRGRKVQPFKALLLERDGHTPPGGEFARRMTEVLTAAGRPMPVFEHRVVIDGHTYYLDLAWPSRMVAVECNDAGSHYTPKAFRRDPMKQNRCEHAGGRISSSPGGTSSTMPPRCSPWSPPLLSSGRPDRSAAGRGSAGS